jgi:hypothetical protein
MTTEPGASAPQTSGRGLLGFLTTIPGILAATAALVTAAGTAYVGVHSGSSGGDAVPLPAAAVVNLTITSPSPPPAGGDRAVTSTQALQRVPVGGAQDPAEQLLQDCADGDGDACAQVIDGLVQECEHGYGASCDVLYAVADDGSDYETYGGTCGYRFDSMANAGTCQEL